MDTSAILAVLFNEPSSITLRDIFRKYGKLYASNLLEAELRSAAAREKVGQDAISGALVHVDYVFPDRPLTGECEMILRHGVPRGADLWHMACALYVSERPSLVTFITMDRQQARIARLTGFPVAGISE